MKAKNEEVAMFDVMRFEGEKGKFDVMKFEGEVEKKRMQELQTWPEKGEALDDDPAYCLYCDEEISLREFLENEEGDWWWDEGVDPDEE